MTAAVAAMSTTAQAQMGLPPTQVGTDLANLAMIAMYASHCKPGNPDWTPDHLIDMVFNQYGIRDMGLIRTMIARTKQYVDDVGGFPKFCALGDQDKDIQAAIARIEAMANRR
jgi:hypothetical protein